MFIGEPMNITKVMFIRELINIAEEHKNFFNFFVFSHSSIKPLSFSQSLTCHNTGVCETLCQIRGSMLEPLRLKL
jgi:hypothetical protein